VGIAIVLEDRHAILFGELQQFGAARLRHDGAGRALSGRDGVDVFRRDAAALEGGENSRQRVHPHALMVERNADRVDAEPGQPVQRALVGVLRDDDGIAAGEQRRVDEVERLQRARHDQDVVGDAIDAGIALEFCRQKLAQRTVTLRAAGEAVGRERSALAPENGGYGVDQTVDRNLVVVVVAADEAVFCKSRPLRCGRGQSRREQWCEVERCGSHGRFPYTHYLLVLILDKSAALVPRDRFPAPWRRRDDALRRQSRSALRNDAGAGSRVRLMLPAQSETLEWPIRSRKFCKPSPTANSSSSPMTKTARARATCSPRPRCAPPGRWRLPSATPRASSAPRSQAKTRAGCGSIRWWRTTNPVTPPPSRCRSTTSPMAAPGFRRTKALPAAARGRTRMPAPTISRGRATCFR